MTLATERGASTRTPYDRPALLGVEGELYERIYNLAEAIRHKKIEDVMAHYAPDVLVFDLKPPLEVRGVAAYRKKFEKWFASMSGRIAYEMSNVHVSADDTHAFSYCLIHVTGARTGGGRADYWVRVTSAWRKVRGEWVVAHEHISMPLTRQ
jgi:ketosteroid isomerase-like protein